MAAGIAMNGRQYHAVRDRLQLHKALPVTPDWSAAPDFLQRIIDHCLECRPSLTLECSSGLTTLALARCCQLNNHGHVYSLENGAQFAAAIVAVLEEFELAHYATIVHAPLQDVTLHEVVYSWYSTHQLPAGHFDLLVVDGPPGFLQRHSRYPALPLLHNRLATGCSVFLDDAARQDEQESVAMWLDEFPAFSHEYIELERGCSLLRRTRR